MELYKFEIGDNLPEFAKDIDRGSFITKDSHGTEIEYNFERIGGWLVINQIWLISRNGDKTL